VVATLGVVAVAALGAQRFLAGGGVLPQRLLRSTPTGPWIDQARYQAPYPDTLAAVRASDQEDRAMVALAGLARPGRDVVAFDTEDGGADLFRRAGWSAPTARIVLVAPGAVPYQELGGTLFYDGSRTLTVGRGGAVYLVAFPGLSGLAGLSGRGQATYVGLTDQIAGYRVFRIPPGASLLGVPIVATAGPRPLGRGL
jgi:hypothetical protein